MENTAQEKKSILIMDKLDKIVAVLRETSDRQQNLSDRLLGSGPKENKPKEGIPTPNGFIDSLGERIGEIDYFLNHLNRTLDEIEQVF